MANADPARNHRYRRLLAAEFVQRRPAARNNHVDILIEPQQRCHQCPVGIGDQLHRLYRQFQPRQHILDDARQRQICAQGFAAAAQNYRIARLEAKGGNVDRHIWARLVNHPQHADRNPTPAQTNPIRQQTRLNLHTHGIGQCRHRARIVRQRGNARRCQRQPVEHRIAHTARRRPGKIKSVGGKHLVDPRLQLVGNRQQTRHSSVRYPASPTCGWQAAPPAPLHSGQVPPKCLLSLQIQSSPSHLLRAVTASFKPFAESGHRYRSGRFHSAIRE